MDEREAWTCGKGLAANAVLPERVARVMATMAEVLNVHMEALDLGDDAARQEYEAYRRVSQQLTQVASQLDATAREMAAYRDLPMGRHDMEAMMRLRVQESLAAFVGRKQEMLALLRGTDESDRQMLEAMQG